MQNRSSEMRFNLLLRQIRTQSLTKTIHQHDLQNDFVTYFRAVRLLLQLRRPRTRLPLQARQAAPAIVSNSIIKWQKFIVRFA